MLLLWVVTCAAVYFLIPEFPPHALTGVTVSLSILAVAGWVYLQQRLRVPGVVAAAAALVAIALFTIPGGIYQVHSSEGYTNRTPGGELARRLLILTPDQSAGLAYLNHLPRPGAVLAPWYLSMSVPGYTARQVFAGHPMWQPLANSKIANTFYSPTLRDPRGDVRRAILRRSGTSFVLTDCGTPLAVTRAIAPVTRPLRRFGCLAIYHANGELTGGLQ